ncbi:hypothetical protein [Celeribacter neptunius]|uniref:hypothetical protein n=1 Tax=Celeribacter neptunius TaxID=588602 RepID=UPI0015A6B765|nr:hypothetical protein [Celeribacter neptunius]
MAGLTDGSYGGNYAGSTGQPWYVQYDPRRLWRERPKQIRLNTKTIRVEPQQASTQDDLAAQLAAKRLEADVVSVVTLD